MKQWISKIIFYAILIAWLPACTPAKIVATAIPDNSNKAELHIYRESGLNAGGMQAIFGANKQDYFEIYNGKDVICDLPAGDYSFFVRSNQADRPYEFQTHLEQGKITCLKITPNPKNLSKAFLPFTYWFGHTFILDKIECPKDVALPLLQETRLVE